MLQYLWLVPLFPLIGFLILISSQGKMPRAKAAVVGAGSIGLAALVAALIGIEFITSPPANNAFVLNLWTWVSVNGLDLNFSFYLDSLSLIMMFVITGVGFLIHLFATGYMADDASFARFFSYMNLFVSAMLVLVLGDNLVLLYLGWEGVGLCSYLLIGFWYTNPENGYAARKAFVVTRVGDTFMAIGLFLLFANLGSLNIQELMGLAQKEWAISSAGVSSTLAIAAALLILGGAVGKSAQLPLQTWLPDAMAGPTPISALIHAATMVTAGVYLIARTHDLFLLAPEVQVLVAIVGCATLLIAGFTALTQTDIKRILAYSTMSQIGYMFLALGVGAWSAGVFHLMTHAFFKALLFLASGTVILSLHHEQNIFKMGGLRKKLPIAFWSFAIGSVCLIALPFTSGYYSKHDIINYIWYSSELGPVLWIGAVAGAFFTAVYTSRLMLIVFFGKETDFAKEHCHKEVIDKPMSFALFVLMALSLIGGALQLPQDQVLPAAGKVETSGLRNALTIILPFLGIVVAYLFFGKKTFSADNVVRNPLGGLLQKLFDSGFGFDWLYDKLFVNTYKWKARIMKTDPIDWGYGCIVNFVQFLHYWTVQMQNGQIRWYASSMAFGLVLLIAIGVWL